MGRVDTSYESRAGGERGGERASTRVVGSLWAAKHVKLTLTAVVLWLCLDYSYVCR